MPLEKLWFRHEFYARSSPKLTDLKMEMKMEGIGIYWCLIEFMYEQNGFLTENDLKVLCFNEHLEIEKVRQVLKLAKFKYDKIKGYYSNGVLERIDKREEFCKKQKEKADKRWEKEKQKKVAPVPEWYEQHQKQINEKLNQEEFEKTKQIKLDSLKEVKEKLFNENKE